jgi:hypothetical protein
MKARPPRNGYAMVLVMVFIALLLTFYSVAYRHVAAAVRAEKVRTKQAERDQGCIQAVGRGVTLLETGLPPSNPYICATTIGTPPDDCLFTVTFESEVEGVWSVRAYPTEWPDSPAPMPSTFSEASGP